MHRQPAFCLYTLLLVSMLICVPARSRAAGPLLVNSAGTPLKWMVNPIPFNPDLGTLGTLSNATAVANVTNNFGVWAAVPTANISFINGGALPVDVTAANYQNYLGVCGDGLNPIVFDTNGAITDALFGAGSSSNILGFAGPDCATLTAITEGEAVLNGKWVDGINTFSNPEISVADFDMVFIHEFGHFFNLDHSQIGLQEAADADSSNDNAIATMFPFVVNPGEQSTLSLDDQVSVSTLYPAPSFASSYGTITGNIFESDGTSPFQGAYVVARKVGDTRLTAVGVASGANFLRTGGGGSSDQAFRGLYTIPGLPPGDYTLEIEPISPSFSGGSGVGPLDPPVPLPGSPEFWNGPNEAGLNPPDDPAAATPITLNAGGTVSSINISINGLPPPTNDDCAAATVIGALPFSDTVDSSGATSPGSDPLQSCVFGGATRNSHSVWYSFTAPSDGVIAADTFGSDYDTVISADTGACGAPAEIACNDDATNGRQSVITLPLKAGQTVLLEVASFHNSVGGSLTLHVEFICNAPTAAAIPKIVISKLKTPPGDDKLTFRGQITLPLPFNPPLNPVADGFLLSIRDTTGGLLNVTIPGGAYSSLFRSGWKVNRAATRWTYFNSDPGRPGGIYRATVWDHSAKHPGLITFVVSGKGGSYPVVAANLPLTGLAILDPSTLLQCIQLSFPGPLPIPSCALNALGSKVTCK